MSSDKTIDRSPTAARKPDIEASKTRKSNLTTERSEPSFYIVINRPMTVTLVLVYIECGQVRICEGLERYGLRWMVSLDDIDGKGR